jgi:hypothetical protein
MEIELKLLLSLYTEKKKSIFSHLINISLKVFCDLNPPNLEDRGQFSNNGKVKDKNTAPNV